MLLASQVCHFEFRDVEIMLVQALRDAVADLPPVEVSGELLWQSNESHLRQLILNGDPQEFLQWDVIVKTMFVRNQPYTRLELKCLREQSDWGSRWQQAIRESSVGRPTSCRWLPCSSGNLIHHAYHLLQLEQKASKRIDDFGLVFEFGGGYGSMCRLVHNLGFQGAYVIFDLPTLSLLQEFFLKSIGVTDASKRTVRCISDLHQLRGALASYRGVNNSLFIATWSVSEVPVELREVFLDLVSPFNAFLIAYQKRFAQTDNVSFFRKWRERRSQQNTRWFDWKIDHLPNHRYLIGISKRG